jgi:hypothetical protein
LLASSAISCPAEVDDVQRELAGIRRGIELKLKHKISRAISNGEMTSDADAAALAGHGPSDLLRHRHTSVKPASYASLVNSERTNT